LEACLAPTAQTAACKPLDWLRPISLPFVDAVDVAVEAGGLQRRADPLAVLEPLLTPLANLPPA
jgi:hypothetical protein